MDSGISLDFVRFFRESLSLIRFIHEEEQHVDIAVVLQGLARALFQAGDITKAEGCVLETLDIFGKRSFGSKSSHEFLWYLADVFQSTLDEGLDSFSASCIDLYEQIVGGDLSHLGLARIVVNLLEDPLTDCSIGKNLHQKSLEIMRRGGEDKDDHASISNIRYRLTRGLENYGYHGEAKSCTMKA